MKVTAIPVDDDKNLTAYQIGSIWYPIGSDNYYEDRGPMILPESDYAEYRIGNIYLLLVTNYRG